MRSIVVFAGFALAAGMIVPRYASQIGAAPVPTQQPPLTAAVATPGNTRAIVVSRDARGHFEVDAMVTGHRLGFIVDTGASVVALTARDADLLGIHPSQNAFTAEVKTANGTVRGALARLDAISVGGIEVRDVAALVLPDEALGDNLLGLSFLQRLRRFEYSDGKLVLEQ
jgi:aspartyl protease family protein